MLNTILLGIVVIELGIIAWNTRKKKIRGIELSKLMEQTDTEKYASADL